MRIVVTGAGGFIGAPVVRALRGDGHEVIAATRAEMDLAKPDADRWRRTLAGADVLVNCAGLFGGAQQHAVNTTGAIELFRCALGAGVARIIQLSAIGVEDELSAFARSKLAADRALMSMEVDWVILRPSIVLGPDANGGSALLRGLAALPLMPVDARAGDLQVVQLADLIDAIRRLVRPDAPARLALDIVGPQRLSFADTVQALRTWLGWGEAVRVRLPAWLMDVGFWLGDVAAWLGWSTPIRSDARAELTRGGVGDAAVWARATGVQPTGLTEALAPKSASAQERLYAACYFLPPLVIGVTAIFFIETGVASLTFGYGIGVELLERGGLGALSGPSVIAGGLADIVTGFAILWRRTVKLGLYAAIAVSLFYFVAGTLLLPELWLDPIGPMMKIWPLIVLNVVGLAMVRDR
ncbi:MAG TPA: SDR family oxidoreductase [Vitreimonas sp.]|uniref:SDR family oxidoreductase n=1 Tax=Vitreimonas sp. TaxID=3069702 RepID=UPI002D4428C0|nr:SDR family oxidoreductase [Vitreimonas sp.]HYD86439.1 SDR family oxidoreductase [Vitreimonas sp.]